MKKSLLLLSCGFSFFAQSQMTMNSSTTFGAGCDCYSLTNGTTNDKGAIWSPAPIDLTQPFDMTFFVYAGNADGEADGMAFVLQQNATGIGDVGYTLGYRDVSPFSSPPISAKSLAIEVDVWHSNPTVATDVLSDHIGMSMNNSVEHNIVAPIALPNIEDGGYHSFRVLWDPTLQVISVFFDGSFIFAQNYDIINTVFTGNPSVYWGWTGATGGVSGTHRVCMYRDADFSSDITSVCPDFPVTFTDASTSDLNDISEYMWDFGDGSPVDFSQNPSHVYTTPGTYTAKLYMTDISGCNDSAQVVITVLPDLIIDVIGTDVNCFGDSNGVATATPQNGTGPYTYAWDDPDLQTTATAIDLPPNTYNVNVTDDLGCEGTGSITIGEPLELMVVMHTSNVLCHDSANAEITAVVINGVSPFSYLWDDPLAQTTDEADSLAPGTYIVTVTDASGCSDTATATVTEPAAIVITGVTTYDNGTSNGSIDATISGGTIPYVSTIWSNAATTEDISGLAAGDYTITVTDDNGCTKDTTFSIKSSVGIPELVDGGFEIYPNPTNGIVQVKGGGNYLIQVTDVSGKIMLVQQANTTATLDLNDMSKGVYFVNIEQNGQRYTSRLVLQ